MNRMEGELPTRRTAPLVWVPRAPPRPDCRELQKWALTIVVGPFVGGAVVVIPVDVGESGDGAVRGCDEMAADAACADIGCNLT